MLKEGVNDFYLRTRSSPQDFDPPEGLKDDDVFLEPADLLQAQVPAQVQEVTVEPLMKKRPSKILEESLISIYAASKHL